MVERREFQTFVPLTVLIPIYNERHTAESVIRRVRSLYPECQIIVVDDGSTDGSGQHLRGLEGECNIEFLQHSINRGKGAAIRTGLPLARGEAVVIQDADLEYEPSDLKDLVAPVLRNEADVIYGTRFHARNQLQAVPLHHAANTLITWWCNRFLNQPVSDVETCYKVIRRRFASQLPLYESRFGIEVELAIKLDRIAGIRVLELPVSYRPRTRNDGKKIRAKDGVRALYAILRYGVEQWMSRPGRFLTATSEPTDSAVTTHSSR